MPFHSSPLPAASSQICCVSGAGCRNVPWSPTVSTCPLYREITTIKIICLREKNYGYSGTEKNQTISRKYFHLNWSRCQTSPERGKMYYLTRLERCCIKPFTTSSKGERFHFECQQLSLHTICQRDELLSELEFSCSLSNTLNI